MGLYTVVKQKTEASGHSLPKAIHFLDSEAEKLMHTAITGDSFSLAAPGLNSKQSPPWWCEWLGNGGSLLPQLKVTGGRAAGPTRWTLQTGVFNFTMATQ